ncbi:MAG: GAF domain-containing protein [Anaerolineae bacterium]|nr:GAF domain-containing protein [Anaerolineae bacterium]
MQLLALYAIFVISVLAAAYIFVQSATDQLEADVGASDLALAHSIAQETSTAMTSALEAVYHLSIHRPVIESDNAGMTRLFENIMSVRQDINLTYRLNADGIMTFHYPIGPESTVGVDFAFRPYFQQALTTHEALISAGRISPTTSQPVATAVMPIWSADDQFLGIVATNIKLQFLSDTLRNISTTSREDQVVEITIIDHDGKIVAHSSPDQLLRDAREVMPELTSALLDGVSRNVIATNADKVEYLYSYVPIPSIDWGVIVSRPTVAAFAVPYAFQRGIFIVSAVFLCSGLLFWLALSRRVIRPLERLAEFSQNAMPGHANANDVVSGLARLTARTDQMGVLTRSVQRMQSAIEARLNELATLLRTSTAVVSTLDSRVVLDRILEQVETLLNVHMSAIFALDDEVSGFRARASRHLPAWYAERIRIDPLDPNSATMRAIRTGEPIQIVDTETDPAYQSHRYRARKAGYRSLLAIRLPIKHADPAALVVYRNEPYEYSEREIRLLTSFANHAAMAIENAALFARSDMHLQEQTRRLESLIQSMHDGLVLEDFGGKIIYVNRRVHELLRLTADSILNKPIAILVEAMVAHADNAETVAEQIAKMLDEKGIRQIECSYVDGEAHRYLRLTLFDVTDAADTLIGRGWIVQDITQRYEVDRMKSNLIATVSHELRTPLAAIKGYATTLLADDVEWDSASQREFLTTISLESDRLNNLVHDLLDMSKIEAGTLVVTPTACDLYPLVVSAANHAMPSANGRLRIDLPPDTPTLYADADRIEGVLRNLLENSAKYAEGDTPIEVSASYDAHDVIIRVIDQGPGIPLEHQEHIFQSFYRLDNGLTRKTAGAGLGLTIARGFVQAHGGRIWLEPRERGLCVAFSIPRSPVHEIPEEHGVGGG